MSIDLKGIFKTANKIILKESISISSLMYEKS
jgi:hypothetical protein